MNLPRKCGWSRITVIAFSLCWGEAALGQAFSSGSTGADGPLVVGNSQSLFITVRAGGVYHYTTVSIATNGSVTYVGGADNSPVTILATGDVALQDGADIFVSGSAGTSTGSTVPTIGGIGGPGGFAGGNGGVTPNLASAGERPGGGVPVAAVPGAAQRGTYGAPDAFVSLIPLFGGSGGAGGGSLSGNAAGGGGGGAILIASSTRISLASGATVTANGGTAFTGSCSSTASGAGSGGAIRLVAPVIAGIGQIRAIGGSPCSGGVPGGDGRIRLEGSTLNFTGTIIPVPSTSPTPGPVFATGNPALVNVPTLAIDSIGGQALPFPITASYFTPDMTLPLGTTNPVPVALTATNTPVGAPTAITVRLIPQSGSPTNVPAANHSGTFSSSTASADVTFPVGRVSVVQAFAAMTLTGQTASLFPLIDGEPVERVMVAASPGAPSTVSLVTKSGKEVGLEELRPEDRIRVALAWETLKETRN